MNKRLVGFGLFLLVVGAFAVSLFVKEQKTVHVRKIGVLVPLEHEAMTQMVAGFREELQSVFGQSVQIDIKNAQGDVGIQRALLVQFAQGGYEAVAVIGTTASLMAIQIFSSVPKNTPTPLVALDVTRDMTQDLGEVTGTLEADSIVTLDYIRRVFAHVRMLSLVSTADDKSYKQAKQFVQKAKGFGLVVQELMVQQPADLYLVGGLVDNASQMIVVLKDHMVASGIAPLVKRATQKRIPLFASDDGTVKSGAALALGVAEVDIGRQGAKLTAQILQGRKASSLAMQSLKQRVLFVNKAAAKQQGVDIAQAVQAAQHMGYSVQHLPRSPK